ncbi:diguanylate cyclase domain-containing protein [Arcobacter sp. YIC-464]|uniref:diguanylate cyclase domain-containing protein n=1 Tax=Arcobacter sp. YIC-464 TaxID=3376631 RepID=UPI003C16BF20
MIKSNYTVVEKIIDNRYYELFEAYDKTNNKNIIVKTFKLDTFNENIIENIHREFSFLNDCNHKYILDVDFLDNNSKQIDLIFKSFKSKTLKQLLHKEKLKLETFFILAIKICEALIYLHKKGIVHNSLSPQSILVSESKEVKLLDLLFSNYENETYETTIDSLYIAPEQTLLGLKSVNKKVDIYSLGIIFYEMLCSYMPFDKNSSLISDDIPFISDINKEVPIFLSKIVSRMTVKDEKERYSDLSFVLADLHKCFSLVQEKEIEDINFDNFEKVFDFNNKEEIFGREEEFNQFNAYFKELNQNNNTFISVSGNSGIGKSTLINYFINKNIDKFSNIIKLKLDKYKQNSSYEFIYEALRNLTRQIIIKEEKSLEDFKEKALEVLGENAKVLIDVIPELEIILGVQPDVDSLNVKDSKARFDFLLFKYLDLFTLDEKPLCIFIDDIQWADYVTLKWIEKASINLKNCFFIVSFRNEEVDKKSPVSSMLDKLHSLGIKVNTIFLKPMTKQILLDYIKNKTDINELEKVSDIIFTKTAGNIFFVKEYLKQLKKDEIIYFNTTDLKWYCKVEELNSLPISDNVFDVLSKRIASLPKNVQNILKIASCIGNSFNKKMLSQLFDDTASLKEALEIAIKEDWIIQNLEQFKSDDKFYSFSHDRMQQIVYSSISNEELKKIHFSIGYKLLQTKLLQNMDLINCVNHLNKAIEFIEDKQIVVLITLNYEASIFSRLSGDFKSALEFVKIAMSLIGKNNKEEISYLEIVKQRAICEQLCHNNSEAIKFFEEAILLCNTNIQKAKVYELLIKFYTDLSEFKKAYEIGLKIAILFNENIPASFNKVDFIYEFVKLKVKLKSKSENDILNLPIVKDEEKEILLKTLSSLLKVAYQIQPELCVSLSVKLINLCLKYGITKDSVIGFMVFGVIFQGGILCKHELADEYSNLSHKMIDKFDNKLLSSEVEFVCGYFANSWTNPAIETEKKWMNSYLNGLEIGDWFHSSCSAVALIQSMFIRGVSFNIILNKIESFKPILKSIGANEHYSIMESIKYNIYDIQGKRYLNKEFDEASFSSNLDDYESKHFAHYYFINKIIALFLNNKYTQTLPFIKKADVFSKASKGMLHNTEYYFYKALIYKELYKEANLVDKIRFRAYIKRIRNKFKKWSKLNYENFLVRYKVLEASLYEINNNLQRAIILYEEANETAKIYGQNQLIYISNKSLSQIYNKNFQNRVSYMYDKEAKESFNAWISHKSSKIDESSNIDIKTLINVMQVISEEKNLKELLKIIIEELMKNAGAQNIVLLLKQKDELLVEAYRNSTDKQTKVLTNIPYMDYINITHTIVNYVLRTHESIIIDDLSENKIFYDELKVSKRKIKSVMCVPLMLHGELKGLIYLENNIISSLFKKDKLDLFKHLSGQIAISIDNALIYNELEQKVEERTKSLDNKNKQLKEAVKKLDLLATLDSLTQLKNRRYFDEYLFKECKRAQRTKECLSLIIGDIDYFKNYNDFYGHQLGDDCLKKVSDILRQTINRPTDLVARYGGEEFVIVLPNTNELGAKKIAKLILDNISKEQIVHEKSEVSSFVTMSLGVAVSCDLEEVTPKNLIKKADDNLYKAKSLGRNMYI